MSAITAKASRKMKKYAVLTREPRCFLGSFDFSWEQRKVGDLLIERNQQAPMSDEYPLMAFIANEGVAPKGERYDRSALSKTWDYKGKGGFQPTKNKSSVRKIQIDWQTVIQFSELVKHLPEDKPIFVNSTVYNSTVNDILGRHCKACIENRWKSILDFLIL